MPPVTSAPVQTSIPTTLDLAEQMNDEEKRKYVKGMLTYLKSFYVCVLT